MKDLVVIVSHEGFIYDCTTLKDVFVIVWPMKDFLWLYELWRLYLWLHDLLKDLFVIV